MAAAPIYPGSIKTPLAAVTTANTTAAWADVWAPSTSNGGKLEALMAAQDSTSIMTLQWAISTGGTAYIIGETPIPASAGTDGTTKSYDVLNVTDIPGIRTDGVNRYFMLAAGYKLQVRPRAAIAAGKTLYIAGQAGDF